MANNKISLFFKSLLLGIFISGFGVNGHAATLPAGYTELEYIESTGTQYIDTGVKGNLNTKIEMDFALMQSSNTNIGIYGSGATTQNQSAFCMVTNSTGTYVFPQFDSVSRTTTGAGNLNFVLGQRYHIVHSKDGWYYDNQLGATWATPQSFTTPSTLKLFATDGCSSSGTSAANSYAKIYYTKIWDGNTLVRDFVPAKNSSGVVGMYDTVSGTFFTNAGTGEFIASPENPIKIATTAYNSARFSPVVTELNNTIATIRSVVTNTINQTKAIADLQATKQTRPDEQCPAGKKCLLVEDNDGQPHWYEIIENVYGLPNGYTALEYIQSTGTQWIDTGIKGNMSYKYEIDFQQLDSGQYRNWGAFNQQSYSGGPNMSLTYASGFSVRWTVSGNQEQRVDISAINANRHKIIIDNGNITWDGVSKGRSTGHQDNYQLNYNLFLGTINPGGTAPTTNAKSKYYSYKVWNTDGNLIQNFIPAKNSSGVVGMYDTVSGQFFTNKGTGTFTAGPEI